MIDSSFPYATSQIETRPIQGPAAPGGFQCIHLLHTGLLGPNSFKLAPF